MITDGVREPSGNKRHRGAGRPWRPLSLPVTPSKRCRGADSPIPCADDVPHDSPRGRQPVVPRHPADTTSTDTQPGLGSAAPVREHDTRGNGGGFAALGASCRRVAGVSRLYCCNSPLLVAVRSRSGAVRSQFAVVWRPHRRPPRQQTPTTGCRRRGSLHCGHNDAWPRVELAREPAIACANRLFRT